MRWVTITLATLLVLVQVDLWLGRGSLPQVWKQQRELQAQQQTNERARERNARVTAEVFARLESVSLDYGVMEHADRVRVVPSDFGWNDVGHWAALADFGEADAEGNVRAGVDAPDRPVLFVDAHGNIVQREAARLVALVGVRDLVVVDTPDALLVCHRDHAQEVRKVVARLEALGREELL